MQPALLHGSLEILPTESDMLCWARHCDAQSLLIAINLTGETLREKLRYPAALAVNGHGFSGYIDDGDIVLEPYDAFFATLNHAG